jgi:multiple sugar transport system permease protein
MRLSKALNLKARNNSDGLVFILPSVLFFLVFVICPFAYSFGMSFTRWKGGSLLNLAFVGLSQYSKAVSDGRFLQALVNTIYYTGGVTIVLTASGLVLALALNSDIRFKTFFRSAYFVPVVMSTVVVAAIWKWVLDSDRGGLLNSFIGLFGLKPQGWLVDTSLAMPSIILMNCWKWLGYEMVIILAALQNIPRELYEAGDMDGTNGLQTFRYITLPMLSNTIWFLVIVGIINSFQIFDQIFIMTGGGPLGATNVLVYYMYMQAFNSYDLGYASAIAWIMFLIIFAATLFQLRFAREEN